MTLHFGSIEFRLDRDGVTIRGRRHAWDWWFPGDPYRRPEHWWGRVTRRKTTT